MKEKDYKIELTCDCLGGKKDCGKLIVRDYKDGDFELETHGSAIFLSPKSIKKLIKYLTKYATNNS